jgi:hypothetical protein
MEPRRIDAFAGWQIESQFLKPFVELTSCTRGILSLEVIETNRQVNEGLQEKTARPDLRCPNCFQLFVALEELAIVEEPDSPLQ